MKIWQNTVLGFAVGANQYIKKICLIEKIKNCKKSPKIESKLKNGK